MDVQRFLTERNNIAESSRKEYGRTLRQLEREIGKPLETMTRDDAASLASSLRKKPTGPQYARVLRVFLKEAGREDLLKPLAMRQRLPKLAPSDILTLQDVQSMIGASASLRDKALIACLWDTGVRVHELLAVRIRDVKIEPSAENGGKKIARVWLRKSKVPGEEHECFLIDAVPVLEAWLKSHPAKGNPEAPLFVGWGGVPLRRNGALAVVKGAARSAGITKRVYNHLFRHSRATFLLASGLNEAQVAVLLGWRPGSPMLGRYAHLSKKDAYVALLKSQGLSVESVPVEHLKFDEEQLNGAVPMVAPPASASHVSARFLESMVEAMRNPVVDPRVVEALKSDPETKNAISGYVAAMESVMEAAKRFGRALDAAAPGLPNVLPPPATEKAG